MQNSFTSLYRSLKTRGFCTSNSDKIVAAVLFERLPVVIPKLILQSMHFKISHADVGLPLCRFRWRQQYGRKYPDEVLAKSDARGKGDYQIDYTPSPRVTEADKTNDRRSFQTVLDRRLFLLLYGNTYGAPAGKPVWHFPEKYIRLKRHCCAESALKSVVGDLSKTYFVGNASFGHMGIQQKEDAPEFPSFKRFFFKFQVIATNKFKMGKCEDHVWVTKDELMENFAEEAGFLNQIIIS
ncbi:hypothetical protein HHK36_029039 [Tetracentron sinense]|uniref:39S ribosomal protein L46, mitochondrial n=1 Tax=Tetracentron sinense TaxID=13715 RepID=A0A834YCB5_TETSI|nr:hypothetical protein HHK36_029039 [Tetracentron sinense]